MRRSPVVLAGVLCVVGSVLAAEPPKKGEPVKPPWQRYLQGKDKETAAKEEKKLIELQQAGRFAEALRVAEGLAALRSKAQGSDHWETVNAHINVEALRRVLQQTNGRQRAYSQLADLQERAEALEKKGRYRQAQPLLQQVLAVHRQVLGEQYPDTATCYNNLAFNQNAQGKYRDAEEGFRKALAICRKLLGEEHPDTATSYNNLAFNQNAQGKYRDAEEGLRRALAIFRKVLGEEHPLTATSYNNLALNQKAQGKYREAEQGFRKALAIRRKILGEEHRATATSYNNLAANQDDQGKHHEAEEGLRKALAIRRKVLGEEHPDTATSYNNLALNQNAQGKYREAEEGLRKALAIRRKILGEEHRATATSYNNLAANQDDQGKYREAEDGYRKALAIRRKVLGEEHPDTAQGYNNLASNQKSQSKYREAEEGYRKALAIRRKVLGDEHPDTAQSYNGLASNQKAQGKYREAEDGYRKALAICRKVLGEEHPNTATCYNNLAANLSAQGKYCEAEEGLRKALAIRRKILGEEHPDTATSYNNLALNQDAQGKYREAQVLWQQAARVFRHARLSVAATGLQRAAFGNRYSPLLALAGDMARNGEAAAAWQRYEESLARGAWDDLATRLRIPQADRGRQQALAFQIDRLNRRLAQLKGTPSRLRDQLLTQLRQQYDALDVLTHELEKKYGPAAGQVVDWQTIQRALPPDTALLGWLDPPALRQAGGLDGEHWAFLLRSVGPPLCVRLPGSGKGHAWTETDDRLPGRLRAALQKNANDWQPLVKQLYRQRLQPLREHLYGVRHLIVLPSVALAGVPIEVVADGYTVSYAHSGTMYAYLHQQPRPTSQGLLALADPIFEPPARKDTPLPPGGVLLTQVLPGANAARAGLRKNDVLLRYGDTALSGPADLTQALPKATAASGRISVVVWRDGRQLSRPLFVEAGKLGVVVSRRPAPQALAIDRELEQQASSRGDHWTPLPGSRLEAAALEQLFAGQATTVLLRSDASEQRLAELARSGALARYRYIHLATHGEVDDSRPLRSAVILARDHLPSAAERLQLLQSGEPIPDGRLTAQDVLERWHLNCELVTLSACETALGKYERGEGFVGFAQALVLAGSRSVCLSLWKVDDTATALLMQRFYQNLLGKRPGLHKPMPKAEALAEAKSWLRQLTTEEALQLAGHLSDGVPRGKLHEDGVAPTKVLVASLLHAGKTAHPFAHPHYWAAFILIGQAE